MIMLAMAVTAVAVVAAAAVLANRSSNNSSNSRSEFPKQAPAASNLLITPSSQLPAERYMTQGMDAPKKQCYKLDPTRRPVP